MSGLDFRAIADMCGTSIMQIERTYYHLNDTIRLTNAVADYGVDSDETIRVVWTVVVNRVDKTKKTFFINTNNHKILKNQTLFTENDKKHVWSH